MSRVMLLFVAILLPALPAAASDPRQGLGGEFRPAPGSGSGSRQDNPDGDVIVDPRGRRHFPKLDQFDVIPDPGELDVIPDPGDYVIPDPDPDPDPDAYRFRFPKPGSGKPDSRTSP